MEKKSFPNNLQDDIGHQVQKNSHIEYRSYPCRWFLLWTIALLNVANNAHWISYASVYSKGMKNLALEITLSYLEMDNYSYNVTFEIYC